MSSTVPPLTTVTVDPVSVVFRGSTDVQPFTYRSGMTYTAILESMRSWLQNQLVPYLNTNFQDLAGSWQDNINQIDAAVDKALADQQAQVAASLAQTLTEITQGENAALNDAAVLNALKVAASTSLAYLDGRYALGIATPEMFTAAATKDASGAVTDWAPAIVAAITAGYRDIELAATYYTCRTPIRVPSNTGLAIRAKSALKASVLDFYLPAGNDTNAAIDVLGMGNGTAYNYGGFTLEGVHVKGNNSVSHGIRMQDASYPWFQNVIIEGFRGAGLYLDVVMDGYFNITIQDCGRTSGDYNSLADRGNNSKTLYSPLFITSYRPQTDACNMLRFTGDIEQNKVSPYVRVSGGIGLQFDKVHAEVRNNGDFGNFDFLMSDGADIEFTGMNMSGTFRDGFLLSPYGVYRFSGGRGIPSIRNTGTGTGRLVVSNVTGANVTIAAWAGDHSIADSKLGDLTITYPGGGTSMVKGSSLGNVSIVNNGAPQGAVIFTNTTMTSFTADTATNNYFLRDCEVSGSVNAQGTGTVENTGIGGTTSVASGVAFLPRRDRGWTVPTLVNGFTAIGSGYAGPGYRRDGQGKVTLCGMISAPATTPSATLAMFTLPVGFRPGANIVLAAASGDAFGDVQVSADGTVNFRKGSGWVSLDGLTFYTT